MWKINCDQGSSWVLCFWGEMEFWQWSIPAVDVGLLPTITDFSSEATVMNLIKHWMMDSYFTLVQHAPCTLLVKSSWTRAELVNTLTLISSKSGGEMKHETLTSLHLQRSEKWSLVRDRFVPGWFFMGNFLAKRSFWLEASFASKFVMIGGAWARNTRFLSRRSLLFRYIVRTSSWPRGHKSWRNHDGFQFITAHKLPTDVLAMHTVADCLLGCHFLDYWMMANGPYEKCEMDTHSTHTLIDPQSGMISSLSS